jgi:nucleoside diphosphate kinase
MEGLKKKNTEGPAFLYVLVGKNILTKQRMRVSQTDPHSFVHGYIFMQKRMGNDIKTA